MSGFLDWEVFSIKCPFCKNRFEALFCIDTSLTSKNKLKTKVFLATGKIKCPKCGEKISTKQIN